MSVKLRTLNNYIEWKTEQGIVGVAKYIETKDTAAPLFPAYVDSVQKKKIFAKRFGNSDFKIEKQGARYSVFYQPPLESNKDTYQLRLQVVYPDKKEDILKELHEDRKTGQGIGIRLFYNLVSGKYLNIARAEVQDFLRSQADYSISRPYNKIKYNKPVLAKKANERWGLDTMKMARYSNFMSEKDGDKEKIFQENLQTMNMKGSMTNILTVIDYFSKKVWARAMKDGTALSTAKAFIEILDESKTRPRILHRDDGKEFAGEFKELIDNINKKQLQENSHQIKTISTKPYSSTSNGLVERANSMIRSRIRAGFVKNNNLEWVKYLPDYVENINNQRPQGALLTPNQLWTQGYVPQSRPKKRVEGMKDVPVPTDKSSVEELRQVQQRKLIEKGQKQLNKGNPPQVFKVGDYVRVALTNTDMFGEETGSLMRKRHKQGGSDNPKYSAVRYSPDIYQISRVIKSKEIKDEQTSAPLGQYWNIGRPKYALKGSDGNKVESVETSKRKAQKEVTVYGSELLLVNKDQTPSRIKTLKRINQINRLEKYEVDEEEMEAEQQELERREEAQKRRQEDKDIEKELIDLYINEEMERALKEGVKTGRRVSKLNTPDAERRYRKSLVDTYKSIDDLPQDFLDDNRKLRDEIRKQDKEERERVKEIERKRREEESRALTATQRKKAAKEKKQEKTKRQQTTAEQKAKKQQDLDIVNKYIEEEMDKFIKSGTQVLGGGRSRIPTPLAPHFFKAYSRMFLFPLLQPTFGTFK